MSNRRRPYNPNGMRLVGAVDISINPEGLRVYLHEAAESAVSQETELTGTDKASAVEEITSELISAAEDWWSDAEYDAVRRLLNRMMEYLPDPEELAQQMEDKLQP